MWHKPTSKETKQKEKKKQYLVIHTNEKFVGVRVQENIFASMSKLTYSHHLFLKKKSQN